MTGRVELAGGWVDLAQQVAHLANGPHRLTTKERDLLAYLAANPGRTIPRSELLEKVWNHPAHASEEPVLSTIKRLRAKIDGGEHKHVVTVHGDGYRFEPPRQSEEASEPIAQALRDSRVVTLTGPLGVGKTTAARRLAPQAPFADLTDARDADGVLRCVAAALNLELTGSERTQWVAAIEHALPPLLVLDGADRALEAVAELASQWTGRMLVTCRERLAIPAERVVPIEPLAPEAASRLFVQRAAEAGFYDADPAPVAEVVERLDRLPLSIELAAAQAGILGLNSLLAQLDSALDTSRRGVPARHASLRAAVAVSWEVLTPWEREAVAQCAVFPGWFTAEAFGAVVSVGRPATAVLLALANRSLLYRNGDRFRLYAPIQAFARGLTNDDSAATRHGRFYASLGEKALRARDGAHGQEAAVSLDRDLENLERAVSHASEAGLPELSVLARSLSAAIGVRTPGAPAVRSTLTRARSVLPGDPRLALAEGVVEGIPAAEARTLLTLAAAHPSVEGLARVELGRLAARAGDSTTAFRELDAAIAAAEREGDRRMEGQARAATAVALSLFGRLRPALEIGEAALALQLETGEVRGAAHTWMRLVPVYRMLGRRREAVLALEEASRACTLSGHPAAMARVRIERVNLAHVWGGAPAALTDAGPLTRELERLGLRMERDVLQSSIALCEVALGNLPRALVLAEEGWATVRGPDVRRGNLSAVLGLVRLLSGDLAGATTAIDQAHEVATSADRALSIGSAAWLRGLTALATHDGRTALRRLDQAAVAYTAAGDEHNLENLDADRAVALSFLGDRVGAEAAFASAATRDPIAVELRRLPQHEAERLASQIPPDQWTLRLRISRWLADVSSLKPTRPLGR